MSSSSTLLTRERLQTYKNAAEKALEQVKGILETKQKKLDEYDSLIRRLEEMPRKRSEAIMCPIGSVGFLPATIVHTNEILVGLGDGYFVDASAYQAAEIVKRRKTVLEKNIADLHEHEGIISKQIAFAKEIFEHVGLILLAGIVFHDHAASLLHYLFYRVTMMKWKYVKIMMRKKKKS
ncbi:unnamed protein product [Haemonchus placei]|uniref:Prefoldin subunit 5 n=1 Tax=Haemonchus placei TaxID=6290 RepID=A0A0N4VXM7_HAEPC|nr:unnamed protein product [Haemonchus placei]